MVYRSFPACVASKRYRYIFLSILAKPVLSSIDVFEPQISMYRSAWIAITLNAGPIRPKQSSLKKSKCVFRRANRFSFGPGIFASLLCRSVYVQNS